MLQSPQQLYKQSSVQTATPAQLIIMLYDGGIRFIKAGIDAMNKRQYDVANLNLKKAQSIVHELTASLNFEFEISRNLSVLYEYFLHRLIQSNLKKEPAYAVEVLGHMEELREVWKQTIKLSASESTVS